MSIFDDFGNLTPVANLVFDVSHPTISPIGGSCTIDDDCVQTRESLSPHRGWSRTLSPRTFSWRRMLGRQVHAPHRLQLHVRIDVSTGCRMFSCQLLSSSDVARCPSGMR